MSRAERVVAHGRNRVAYELLPRDGPILDYGCGEGSFITAVAELLDVEAHGCDIRPEAIERLNGKVEGHVVSDSDPALPFPDGHLASVSMCDVLEHLPEQARGAVLAEIRRVLRPDGALVLTVPHAGAVAWADPENLKFRFPRLHRLVYRTVQRSGQYDAFYGDRPGNYSVGAEEHHHFSRGELEALLTSAGFRVEEVRYYSLFEPFLHGAIWVIDGVFNRTGRGKGRLNQLLWRWYVRDADRDAGRLSGSVAIRAVPMA